MNTPYVPRLLDAALARALTHAPALLVAGPRAVGKTTTAGRVVRAVVRLDREAEAVAFRADPDVALRSVDEPVLLDEWQAVPGVLGAVKRAVDADRRPGRFVLTGSVRTDLDAATWPGTGRLLRLVMWGLTGRERFGDAAAPSLVDRLLEQGQDALAVEVPFDLGDYVRLALEGGFPDPVLRGDPAYQAAWLDSYVAQLVTRDAELIEGGRDPARLRRYFEAYAANTATTVDEAALIEAARVDRKTANGYRRLLENLLVVDELPAWTSNRLKRLVLQRKRHLADPALAGPLLVVDQRAVLRDGTLLGRLLETYAVAQLRAEVSVAATRCRLLHLRTKEGRHEIDAIIETAAGLLAFEVRADAAPSASATTHLRWLRDELGDDFVLGVVLHTGPRAYGLGDRLLAAPLGALHAPSDAAQVD